MRASAVPKAWRTFLCCRVVTRLCMLLRRALFIPMRRRMRLDPWPAQRSSVPACLPGAVRRYHMARGANRANRALPLLLPLPGGDDRKGGAGELGKCFMSCDDAHDCKMLLHVPKALQGEGGLNIKEWAETMINDPAVCGELVEVGEETIKAIAKTNTEKQLFPLKQRDSAINASFAMLRSKNLVMEDDSDSETDMADMYENAGVEW